MGQEQDERAQSRHIVLKHGGRLYIYISLCLSLLVESCLSGLFWQGLGCPRGVPGGASPPDRGASPPDRGRVGGGDTSKQE